ncbi:MAG: ABC transporter ATP-binding protein [Firmicutes bacterium]|nr:ABC transporter ATP-binding protein [Bacillota bacterium]
MTKDKLPIVELQDITKTFPGVVANDQVDFQIYPGEVHALLGENGAGKTTLMNILYGLYPPDAGRILVHGKPVTIANPNDALALGIGMVHQHFMLVPPFTVAENIVLGYEPKKRGGFLDMDKAIRDVEELSTRYGFRVDPRAKVQDISVGMQQRVEILKALYRGAEVLILDEPTAVLTPQEVEELKEITDNLARQGTAIIFITHKLQEVMAMSQRITVIRRGRVVGTVPTASTNPVELARMMVGRDVVLTLDKEPGKPGPVILRMEDVWAEDDRRLPALKGVSLQVRAGEIIGIAGVDGNGQRELSEVLLGTRKVSRGIIYLKQQDMTNLNVRARKDAGLGHIPEDRQRLGMIMDFSLAENAILGKHHRAPFKKGVLQDVAEVKAYGEELLATYDVRAAGVEAVGRSLSGGNQQKVVVGRELDANPEVLIAAQPTRGLDVGAIEFVHGRLLDQRAMGKGILLISFELDELLSLSDRILVIYEGQIVAEVKPENVTEGQLGLLMTGGSLEGVQGL